MGQFFRCSIYFKGVPTNLMSKKNTTEQFPRLSNTLVDYFFCSGLGKSVWYVTDAVFFMWYALGSCELRMRICRRWWLFYEWRLKLTFYSFQFYQPHWHFSREEIISLVKDVIRTVWWYIFLEGFLHFVYATAFTQEPEIFKSLSNWALCGILYSMLQIFLVKYKVFYLGAGLFARMDGVTVPLPPRCVSTLYLFSDMWK